MEKQEQKKLKKTFLWIALGVVMVFIIFFIGTYTHYNSHGKIDSGWDFLFGEFGDSFGMLNALFTGLAMTFAGYAILYQAKELGLQHEEMKDQREILRLQHEELKMQLKEQSMTRLEFELSRTTSIIYKQLERVQREHEIINDRNNHKVKQLNDEVFRSIQTMNSDQFKTFSEKQIEGEYLSLNRGLEKLGVLVCEVTNCMDLCDDIEKNILIENQESFDLIESQFLILRKILTKNLTVRIKNLGELCFKDKIVVLDKHGLNLRLTTNNIHFYKQWRRVGKFYSDLDKAVKKADEKRKH